MANNNGIPKMNQWHQNQPQNPNQLMQNPLPGSNFSNGQQPSGPINPLANYTLPGVINYLTNEFTNLERFKIMTNLEKSEMKYRITQLQGEVNSLKYFNEEQKVKISQLEKENRKLRQELQNHTEPTGDQEPDNHDNQDNMVHEAKLDHLQDIPEVDLQIIKDSRYQLTKSMKEVIHLLRSPVNANLSYLDLPDANDTANSFDELFSHEKSDTKSDSFSFHKDSHEGKSVTSKYFNTSTDDLLEEKKLSENFDNLLITKHDEPLESDNETVVLDGSNEFTFDENLPQPNLANDNDDKLEITEFTIKGPDGDFGQCKVFNNKLNQFLTCIQYDHQVHLERINIKIFDTANNHELLNFHLKKADLEDIASIVDIYCFDYDADTEVAKLLIIYKNGQINQFVLDKEDPLSTVVLTLVNNANNNEKPELEIITSGLIEFSHKSNELSKALGLALTVNAKKQSKIQIYELTTGPRNDLKSRAIGEYNRGFFKKLTPPKDDGANFEIIKWFKADKSAVSSPKSKQKHYRSLSADDISLSPYQLIIKLEKTIFVLNIVLKHYFNLTDYSSNFSYALESNNASLILNNVVDDISYQILIYDLSNSVDPQPNTINVQEKYNANIIYTTINHGSKQYIAKISDGLLLIYDAAFNLIQSNKTPSSTIYRVGNSFIANDLSHINGYRIG